MVAGQWNAHNHNCLKCSVNQNSITSFSSVQFLFHRSHSTSSDSEGLDGMTFNFLRQAVYHFLADIHPEDHLRSISSILKLTPQERKSHLLKIRRTQKMSFQNFYMMDKNILCGIYKKKNTVGGKIELN